MPALSLNSVVEALLFERYSDSDSTGLHVVCAWPLSSQYGPGSRVLYYVLIAACVFARKSDWLRNACVGLALLVPVIAALHGVVLAAAHVDGAVDMDIYGAFQTCAIGVLAAPVAVRQSTTYFNHQGRNTIFVWVLILLSGLVSLTIEFYRANTTLCERDDNGNPIVSISGFPYKNVTRNHCGLPRCSSDDGQGPFSPIRGGSADNIYIIPAPDKLTFNTATLLAAACCIPAILLLVSMWFKILEFIWKAAPKEEEEEEEEAAAAAATEDGRGQTVRPSSQHEKANHAECLERQSEQQQTAEPQRSHRVANAIREYGEIVVFGAAVLAILIIGERNMWSSQLRYEQEPIGNIGQWSPLAGTTLAVLGSAYLLLAEGMEEEKAHPGGKGLVRMTARSFMRIGDVFGSIASKLFDDSEFRRGQATGYPVVPGEEHRNPGLSDTRSIYSPSLRRDSSGSDRSTMTRQRSGAAESSNTKSRLAKRRDTLEVPASPGQYPYSQGGLSRCVSEQGPSLTRTPTIVVSPSPVYTPDHEPRSRRHTTESAMR